MTGQTFMLIECPNCFALMRGRAKYCRRCGQELANVAVAADKPNSTAASVKTNVRVARFLVVVGVGLLVWGISAGSADRSILGGFLLMVGIAGQVQVRKIRAAEGKLRRSCNSERNETCKPI